MARTSPGCGGRLRAEQYAPFAVDIVEDTPAQGPFITAVIGGRASLMGLDDVTTDGVGPYDGTVIRDATVHVFSVIAGEADVDELCAATAHEIGHALGLDHEMRCGDVMSYSGAQCGARTFVDEEAPCGEDRRRTCGDGNDTQSSYRLLASHVGWRAGEDVPARAPPPVRAPDDDDSSGWRQARRGHGHDHGIRAPATSLRHGCDLSPQRSLATKLLKFQASRSAQTKKGLGMTRLENISSRSKSNRLTLALFAAMLTITTFVSASSVGTVIAQHVAMR